MILVKPSSEIMSIMNATHVSEPLQLIEAAGRTCYKSESKITSDSAKKFVHKLNKLGHKSVIEHSAMTVRIICDRGVTHEIVRHRLASYSQESTRYCNYEGGVTFVIPPWVDIKPREYLSSMAIPNLSDSLWYHGILEAEHRYIGLLKEGWSPQQARSVLPNSTKTEIVITANFREWQHIFTLRCAKPAHPQMREVIIPLHKKCKELIPVIFDDIDY